MLLLDEPLSNLDANLREEMRFEVRRLHQAYHYTTVYVTHDQSEAMTTADLIAVMNAGRIEQLGSPPRNLPRQPRSEFVARFLGGSNIIRGQALDAKRLAFAGATIECHNAAFAPGKPATAAVRQHDIRLLAADQAAPSANALIGTVVHNAFLAPPATISSKSAVACRCALRLRHEADFAAGSQVGLLLPADRCHALLN